MTWRTSFLLALIIASCHGNPASRQRRSSRVQERAGGFMEFGDIPIRLRGLCNTVLNVENVLTTFPLSLVSGVALSIPLPILNPLILDPLRLYEFSQSTLMSIQNTINGVSSTSSRKRDLRSMMRSLEVDRLNSEIEDLRKKLDDAYTSFRRERRSVTEREAEDPGKPGYLLTLKDILAFLKRVCPWNDLLQSFYESSFLSFLHLERIPLPIPNGESVNILKAIDIWNVEGGFESLVNSIKGIFGGGVAETTTPAPSGGFLSALFASAPVETTTAAPNFFQSALSSIGNLFGLGGSSAPKPPETAAVMQDDEGAIAEVPEQVVMVAMAPVKVSTVAPVKLSGSILGVNMDWLFGNDSAKPLVEAPTTAATSKVGGTTTPSPISNFFNSLLGSQNAIITPTTNRPSTAANNSPTTTAVNPTASTTTTKAPVQAFFDSLFGKDNTAASSTNRPTTTSNAPSVTTTAVNPTASTTTTKAPVQAFLDSLFGKANTAASSTNRPTTTSNAPSVTTTTRATTSNVPPTTTTTRATTTTVSPATTKASGVLANPTTGTAPLQSSKVNAATTAATLTSTTAKSGGFNLFGWQVW